MKITGMEFRECMAHILCMEISQFEECFGPSTLQYQGRLVPYQWHKLRVEYDGDVARWVCYLDLMNLDALVKYLEKWVANGFKDL